MTVESISEIQLAYNQVFNHKFSQLYPRLVEPNQGHACHLQVLQWTIHPTAVFIPVLGLVNERNLEPD